MNKKGLLITTFLAITGGLLSLYLILHLDTFLWDEAHHAFFGNLIYKDLRTFNVPQFFADTGRQAWFQPFHSYLNGLFMLIFGKSYLSIRSSSLFTFVLLFFSVFKLSKVISKEKGWLIAAIANILLVTSPIMLVLSSLNMQEMLGALIITSSLIYYIDKCKNEGYVHYLIFGFILSLVLLVKYHYGILLGASIFLIETSKIFDLDNKLRSIKFWITNDLLVLAGFLPLTLLWFMTPPVERKIGLLLYRAKDVQGWGRGLNLFERALFYVQSILTSCTFSFWTGLFVLFSIIYCFRYFKDIKIRSLLILFMTFFMFHSYIVATFERLIVPAIPAVFILASYASVDIYNRYLKFLNKSALKIIAAAFVVILLGDLIFLAPYAKDVANYSMSSFVFQQNIQDINPPFLFGLAKRPGIFLPSNPAVLNFPGFTGNPHNKLRDVLDYFSLTVPKGKSISTMISLLEMSPYEFYWHFALWGGNIFTINDYSYVGKYFWFSEYFLELEINGSSPYFSQVVDNSLNRWKELSALLKQKHWLTLYSSREFKDLGITANIYKMKLPY